MLKKRMAGPCFLMELPPKDGIYSTTEIFLQPGQPIAVTWYVIGMRKM